METKEMIELADLEPQGEVRGGTSGGTALPSAPVVDLQSNSTLETLASRNGTWTGNITLGTNATIGATQGRGVFTISTSQ